MATYYGAASEMQSDGLQTLYLMNPGYVGYSETQTPATGNMMLLSSGGAPINPTILPYPSLQNQHDISAFQSFVPRVPYQWTAVDPTGGSPVVPPQQVLSLSLSPQQPTAYGTYRPGTETSSPAPPPAVSPASGNDVRISGSSSSASPISNGISGLRSVLMGSRYLKAAQQLLDEVVSVGKDITSDFSKGNKEQNKLIKAMRDYPTEAESSVGAEINGKQPAAELTTADRQELQMKKTKLINMIDEVEQRYRQYHHQMQAVISSFESAVGAGSAKTYTALALQTISKQFRCLRDAIAGQIRAISRILGEEDSLGGSCKGGDSSTSRLRFVDQQIRQQRALQQLGMMHNNAWRPQRGLPERSVSVLRAWLFEHFLHPYPKDSDKLMLAKQTGLSRSQVSNWFINARVRLWKPMVEEMYLEETKEQEQNCFDDKTNKSEINEDVSSKSIATQENCPTEMEQKNGDKMKGDSVNESNSPLNTMSNSPGTTAPSTMRNARAQDCFSLIGSPTSDEHVQANYHDDNGMLQQNQKKARISLLESSNTIASMEMDLEPGGVSDKGLYMMKFSDDQRPTRDGYSFITGNTGHNGCLGTYPIGEIGRFDPEQFVPQFSGNGVSLTLGLPHSENLPLSATQQNYLSNHNIPLGRRLEMDNEGNEFCSISTASAAHSASAYGSINIQNRKQFAAHLLQDFVA